jgi:ClpP class serine protease
VSELADGFIFTGVGAQKVGLVDEVGTKDAAIVYLEETLNATVVLEETQESSGLLDLLYGYSQRFMPSVQTQMQIKT